MIYAEFQKLSTGWNGTDFSGPKEPIPALGSDGVFILDGRERIDRGIEKAKAQARILNRDLNKGIVGLVIHSGRSFTDSKPIGKYITL